MALQLSVAVRDARLDAIETTVGTSAVLQILSGSLPANCAASDSGTVLAQMTLPSTWMSSAASGAKAMTGTWHTTDAAASGTAAHFRLFESTATTCHLQGTVTATGGGGDLTLDSTTITANQTVTITSFTLTDGNA